jgi:hypothetical protein
MMLVACIFSIFAKPPAHVQAADELMASFNTTQIERYHVEPLQQTGLFEKGIQALFLDYQIDEILTEDQVKALLLDISSNFLEFVNQDTKIVPYLTVYPLTDNHISVSIHSPFETLKEGELSGGEISGNTVAYYYRQSGQKRPILVKKEGVR